MRTKEEKEISTLHGHTGRVNDCTLSYDGRTAISASSDGTLKVWDVIRGEERLTLYGHKGVVSGCTMSQDGQIIASASDDHTLKIWDGVKGFCLFSFPIDGPLSGCVFHPDNEYLMAWGAQGIYFLRLIR